MVMRLLKVSFRNYKVLASQDFKFDENPFYLVAPNEAGKSTLIEGIKDAFSLMPERLKPKKTEGQDLFPVIEVTFQLKDERYQLKVNAQDETVSLKGSDGTDLSRREAIEKFWAKEGYLFFPTVLSELLILRERELAVDTARGLRRLLNAVLKYAAIEELKRSFEGILIFKPGSAQRFKQQSFGKDEKRLKEELRGLEEELKRRLEAHEEFRKNQERLKKIRKGLEEKKKRLEEEKETLKARENLYSYLRAQALQEKIKELEGEGRVLQGELEKLAQGIKALEEGERELEEGLRKAQSQLAEEKTLELLIEKAKAELKGLQERLPLLERLARVEAELGKFKEASLEELERDLLSWKTYLHLKKARGMVKVLKAKEEVILDQGRPVREGEIFEFEGKAGLSYRDLRLEIYASSKVGEEEGRVRRLEETYGSPEKLSALKRLKEERERLLARIGELEDREGLKRRIETLKKRLEELFAQRETLLAQKRGLQALYQNKEEISRKIKALQGRLSELRLKKERISLLKEGLKEEYQSLEREIENLTLKEIKEFSRQRGLSLEALEQEIEARKREIATLEREIERLEKDEAYLRGVTQNEPDPGALEEVLSRKRETERKLSRLYHVERLLRSGLEVLEDLRQELNRAYLKEFEARVNEFFSFITHGEYRGVEFCAQSLFFDGETFSKEWRAVRRDGVVFPISELSDGTAAQLLLSARLALIRLFFDRQAFLLFDEPFAYFDQQRTTKTKDILTTLAEEGWQIIVMSAKP